MDRYSLENPSAAVPDAPTHDQRLIAQTGNEHEQATLAGFRSSTPGLLEVGGVGIEEAKLRTMAVISRRAPSSTRRH